MRLTGWYRGDQKPVRKGVYEILSSGIFSHWDGKQWGPLARSKKEAALDKCNYEISYYQDEIWRGIKK
jgi:hypothetical protein